MFFGFQENFYEESLTGLVRICDSFYGSAYFLFLNIFVLLDLSFINTLIKVNY